MRTLFGSGRFGVPILEALVAAPEVELVGVVSVPDRPVGRSQTVTPTPVAARALELGVPVLRPVRLRDPEAVAEIANLVPDLGVLADYGRIVPPAILDLPERGILNVHPSLLPRHRGATPIPAAILAGDAKTGVTLIRMDAGVDTGPRLAWESWPLDVTATAPELGRRGGRGELLRRSLASWLDGSLDARPRRGRRVDDPPASARRWPIDPPHRRRRSSARSAYQPGRSPSTRRWTGSASGGRRWPGGKRATNPGRSSTTPAGRPWSRPMGVSSWPRSSWPAAGGCRVASSCAAAAVTSSPAVPADDPAERSGEPSRADRVRQCLP
jgi:hypothetical protein